MTEAQAHENRIKVFATAAALQEFSAPEAAAYAGTDVDTTRQILQKEPRFFLADTSRKLVVWTLRDPAALLDELEKLKQQVPSLVVERREQAPGGLLTPGMMMTPAIGPDYWSYRVMLGDQAILAFPKFATIGIGFALEEDWNTNLPWSCEAEEIFAHIKHNKGSDAISDEVCIEAIRLIQAAIAEDGHR